MRAPAAAAQFEFKCASTLAVNDPCSVRARQMWQSVEHESGGRVRTQFFPNGELGGSDAALVTQLRLGALHFWFGLNNLPSLVPAVAIAQVAFAFRDNEEALRAMDGALGAYIRREIVAKGIVPLSVYWTHGMREITSSSHPIRTADDLNGFRLRVVDSPLVVDFFKTLGANAVTLGVTELYTALQTHVVDGEDNPLDAIETLRLYEVQRYLSLTNHNWAGLALMASVEAWNSLPPDLQDVVQRNNARFARLDRRDAAQIDDAVADKWRRRGIPVNVARPDTFKARLGPYYATWAKNFGPTAWGLLQSSGSGKLG